MMENEVISPDFDIGIAPSLPPVAEQNRIEWAGLAAGGRGIGVSLVNLGIAVAKLERRSNEVD